MNRLPLPTPAAPHPGDRSGGDPTGAAGPQPKRLTPDRPLLIDIDGLALLLTRSVPSLHRDDAAGRLPTSVRIGGSKRWRYSDIVEWVDLGCPSRAEFEARRGSR